MKKRIIVLVLASVLSAAVLSGCTINATLNRSGSDKKDTIEVEEDTGEEAEDEAGSTYIGNPWRDVDADEIAEVMNAGFIIPDGATDVHYSIMDEGPLAQADFTYDGLDFTARMQRTDDFEDISGCYYDWDVEDECEIFGSPAVAKRALTEEEMVDVFLWRDEAEGLMFSLNTADKDLDGFDIQAVAESMYQPASDEFMPSDFLQERTGRYDFDSYDEVISLLEKDEGYAYVELTGYKGEILLITDYVYDNMDGNMASIQANVYADYDGVVTNIGNVFTQGTAYPIACENGLLYLCGSHTYESDWISSENHSIMVKDYIYEDYDSDGNVSYAGFMRETPDYDNDKEVDDEEGARLFTELNEEGMEKKIVNFTVVD